MSQKTSVVKRGLEINIIGKEYKPDTNIIAAYQQNASMGGSTSIRNVPGANLEWKKQGYYQRNRDLGQVFEVQKNCWLKSIVIRTGPSNKAVLSNTPGAHVFLQLFEVSGQPFISDNNTSIGQKSKHGFSDSHRSDDILNGVVYKSLKIIEDGIFPDVPVTFRNGRDVNGDAGKLVYLRIQLIKDSLELKVGKKYAFLIGLQNTEPETGFTLANINSAAVTDAPNISDEHDKYHYGWGIRREGDGTLPPTILPGDNPPRKSRQKKLLLKQSLFPSAQRRYTLEPTADGYPDVDTYRDLNFALEVRWIK